MDDHISPLRQYLKTLKLQYKIDSHNNLKGKLPQLMKNVPYGNQVFFRNMVIWKARTGPPFFFSVQTARGRLHFGLDCPPPSILAQRHSDQIFKDLSNM